MAAGGSGAKSAVRTMYCRDYRVRENLVKPARREKSSLRPFRFTYIGRRVSPVCLDPAADDLRLMPAELFPIGSPR